MRATKKTSKKKHSWRNTFYLSKWNCFFFGMFFYLPKLTGFFSEIGKNLMRALGRKKHVFFGNARPKSNARAHLKQRKKHSGLNKPPSVDYILYLYSVSERHSHFVYIFIIVMANHKDNYGKVGRENKSILTLTTVLLCKAKRQHLLTLQVSRYCLSFCVWRCTSF